MKPIANEDMSYQYVWQSLRRAEVVPFLGAGASVGLVADDACAATGLPAGRELANRLAARIGLPPGELDGDDLIEVASCFALLTDRLHLEDELKEVFGGPQRPGQLHRFLATLSPVLPLIVTTNYDTLIEQGLRSADQPFHLIMTLALSERGPVVMWWQPEADMPVIERSSRIMIQPTDIPIVYKMHGGLAPGGDWIDSVVTEDDYFQVGGRVYTSSLIPSQAEECLSRCSLLFLGYSLRNIHVRYLLGKFARRNQRMHYLVSKAISRIDAVRLRCLNVVPMELTISDFLERISTLETG